jgi:PAS domain S-box-containing protein
VGTAGGGLLRYQGRELRRWTLADGLPDLEVLSLAESGPAERPSEVNALAIAEQPSGTLVFVGTPRGLGWWDGARWSWLERDSRGEPLEEISALLPAPPGEPPALWVGTDSGAARWTGESWQVFDVRSSGLPANLVRALLPMVDAGRRLPWIGLRDGGLARLTLDGWSTLDLAGAGLATRAVYTFGESGPAARPTYWLGTEDGLPGLEGNQGGLMRDRQGRIWAGMFNGVGILDSTEAAPVSRLRELQVRALAVDGRSWEPSAQTLELPPNPRELVVAVTLPSYLDRSSVRYQAQLVGLQAEPSAWAAGDSWSYPELPPGNYRFRAWARDRTGAVLAAPELVLRVPPTLWERLSVRLGLLVSALLRARWVSERSQEEGYRRIFKGAQDAIIVFDPTDEEILAVNARACELYGWSREEMVGRTIKAFSTDISRGEQEILHTLEQGAHHHFETRQLDRSGRVLDLECTASVIRYGGRTAILSLNRDLSERREAVELSLAKEAAERSAQAKSRFLAAMSHEMRTPLTSILGALGLLGRVDLDQAQELLVIARRNAERLLGLVNDLLDLQQAEAGEMRLELGPVDLRHVVEETIANLRGLAQGREVKLVLVPALGGPATVRADAVRLGQVVANLLSNAIKFTARGTAVTVRIEALGGRWRVSVIDQGSGVPEEFRARIFERFAQADSSDKCAYGGTGLGLSIAKSFVELMGGSIGFDSAAGTGSTFYFELPVLPSSGSA